MKKSLKSVAVDLENYDRLQKLGHPPDSFNDVIRRLLDTAEAKEG
jgi:predicted CopG family antitoxin